MTDQTYLQAACNVRNGKDRKNRDSAINDYGGPTLDWLTPTILIPTVTAEHFELKPIMFQMLNMISPFTGAATEDPHIHLKSFVQICDTFKMAGVSSDVIRLSLFPYSLRDQAIVWLHMLPGGSITTWTDLVEKFLKKFFPPAKHARLRNDILTFRQIEGESLHETWERYKGMINKFPQHGIPDYIQIETFYFGMVSKTRDLVDAKAGGALLDRQYEEIPSLLDEMSRNFFQLPLERVVLATQGGKSELDAVALLTAKVEALSNKLESFTAKPTTFNVVDTLAPSVESCIICGEGHQSEVCPMNLASACSEGNYRNNQNNPYSNSYNQGWKNHPNFSWTNTQGVEQPRQQGLPQKPSLEELMKEFMAKTDETLQSHGALIRSIIG